MADNLNILLTAKLDYGKSQSTIKSQINSINSSIGSTNKVTKDATKGMMSFGESIQTAAYKFAIWSGVTVAYYGTIRAIAKGIETVKDLDTAMVDLRKVTDATEEEYEQFANTAFEVGKQLARTGEEVIQTSNIFARTGKSMQESLSLATEALELTNVADDIDNVNESASTLIATMYGFRLEADSAGAIVDKLNEVSNNFAVTIGDLSSGISKESATLRQANNDLDQSIALITGGTEVMRDPRRVATGLRTIALRLRGVGEEGESLSGLVPKLEENFQKFGITLLDENDNFRSTYDILGDLASVYEDMSDLDLANISELVSGKRQSTVLNAILSNWKRIDEARQTSMDSLGSAAKENAKYLDSIEGKTKKFTSAVQNMWRNTISTDTVKDTVDFGTALVDLIDKVGLLNTAFMALFTTLWVTGRLPALSMLMQNFGANIAVAANNMGMGANAALNLGQAVAKIGPMLAVAGIIAGVTLLRKHFEDARHEMQNLASAVDESRRRMEENTSRLDELARQYEELANKANLTSQEKAGLLNIERELKIAFGETGDQIDLQNKSLEENMRLIKQMREEEAQHFIDMNQSAYERQKKFLESPYDIDGFKFKNIQEAIDAREEALSAAKLTTDLDKILYDQSVKILDNMIAERDAALDMKLQYENRQTILDAISNEEPPPLPNPDDVEALTNQFSSLTDEINVLYKSVDKLDTDGMFDPSTLDSLIEKYPEIISYLHDETQLREFLTNKIKEQEAIQLQTYQNILIQSEDYFNSLLEGYEGFYNQLVVAYGSDAENFKSLADAKAETEKTLIKYLGDEWSKYYGSQEEALRAVRANFIAQRDALKLTGSAMFVQYQSMINQIDAQLKVLGSVSDSFANLDLSPINLSGVGSAGEDNTIIDAIEDLINSQIDALQDKIDAEQRIIDQLNEQYDKEKALANIEQMRLDIVKKREELANIRKEKNVRLYNPETGRFEWVADPREVKRAEEELSGLQEKYEEARRDYRHDMEVKRHQDMINSYRKQIDSLKDYLKTMEELTKKSVEEQLAEWNRLNGGSGSKGGSSSGTQNNQSQINKLQEELRALWLRYNELKNSGYTKRTEAYNAYLRKREEIARLGGIPQYEKGGKVPNTGPAILHKDEIVLNKPTAQLWERTLLPFMSNIVGMLKGNSPSSSDNSKKIYIDKINVSSNDPHEFVDGLEALSIIRK